MAKNTGASRWDAFLKRPPWEWPENAPDLLIATLRDASAPIHDKRTAAALAGQVPGSSEELVEQLLATVASDREDEQVRASAVSSLGPVLESCDLEGFDDPVSDPPVSQDTFRKLQTGLRALYQNQSLPKLVRRRILEASVQATADWHTDAIRAAYDGDDEWKLTAVFSMGHVRGFDSSILEALRHPDEEIQSEAITAAGNWELQEAWPIVSALLKSSTTPKPLLLAAIGAVAGLRPDDAEEQLDHLAESDDEEIADAVEEVLVMSRGLGDDDLD